MHMTANPQPEIRTRARFPRKLQFLFRPARYKVAHGGRGSSKSWSVARALVLLSTQRTIRVLCCREVQKSIRESVHTLLTTQIEELGLDADFDAFERVIRNRHTGSEFLFEGLKGNVKKIKSMEGIDIAWVEEADTVSNASWQVLIPTIRKPGSEIWVTFNPDEETDPTYVRFVKSPPPNAVVVEVNWRDNPWFPQELREEMEYLRAVDYEAYLHVWEGQCTKRSDAQILNGKWRVEWFEPDPAWDGPYQGADWGFANDPTTLVQLYIDRTGPRPRLMVFSEAWGLRVDLDNTPELFDKVPGARQVITRADSARPETISHMQNHGYPNVTAVEKWDGSVEDGIAFLRAFAEIVIHPECKHTIEEARLYSYKIDKLTGDIKPEADDKHNHCIDAIRYALAPMIQQSKRGMLAFIAQAVREQAESEDLDRRMRALTGG
mgnify:CR=1 FL=1